MSHVDYLCPACNKRVGVSKGGSSLDPLDYVTCENCHRSFRFHYLIRDNKVNILKSGGGASVGPATPGGNQIQFVLGGTDIAAPWSVPLTVPPNSTVVAALASVWLGDVDQLVADPIPTWSGLSPDETPVNKNGIPDPSLLAENLHVWQWYAPAGGSGPVSIAWTSANEPDKATLYVFYLNNIVAPFTDYPTLEGFTLQAGVGTEFSGDSNQQNPGVGPSEANEMSVCIHYTNGPASDDQGVWQFGFQSGGRAGTAGGLDLDNSTIDVAWHRPNPAPFTVAKVGFTSQGFIAYNKVFKSVLA